MLKARSKKLSLLLVLAMLMTMFAGVGAVSAASMYQVLKAPTVAPIAGPQDIDAVVKVTLPDTAIAAGSILTVSMPSDWTFPNQTGITALAPKGVVTATGSKVGGIVEIVASGTGDALDGTTDFAGPFNITPNNAFDIELASPITTSGTDKFFYIYFNGVNLNNSTGDLTIDLIAPSGSAFETALNLTIGKSDRSGSTMSTIKKVKEISSNDTIDIIAIGENSGGTLNSAGTIDFKILTKGVKWDTNYAPVFPAPTSTLASYSWAFAGTEAVPMAAANLSNNDKTLSYNLNAAFFLGATDPGKIGFANLPLEIDDILIEPGTEIEVKISGASMTAQTLVVAKYVDFGLEVAEVESETVLAGKTAQEIGAFVINEKAAGSWVEGRTITFALPSGARWVPNSGEVDVMNNSDITIAPADATVTGDNNEYLKLTLATGNGSQSNGAKIELSEWEVDLAPDFTGDLELTVSGNAGVTGTVKVAEVNPVATMEVAGIENVILGMPNQAIGDITITETKAEALMNNAGIGNEIRLVLDPGYRFANVPTVEVTEGDLELNSTVTVNEENLVFSVKSTSVKEASTIVISDILIDGYRTAPEGRVMMKIEEGTSALVAPAIGVAGGLWPNVSPGKVQVANCITPAEGAGIGEFVIGSNIYVVNGVTKIMDVAPYIRDSRTFVPMRYAAEMIGAEVIWDEDARTVTLTRDDDVVVFTLGSATYTVNDEAMTADVACEVVNDRAMLPARFVAEAFGAVVGWDPGTQTVLIQK